MGVAEMRMLRGMCGHTRKDKIENEDIRGKVGVAEIEGKMRENRFRRPTDAPVRRCDYGTEVQGRRGRGRPRKTLEETLRKDLEYLDLTEDMTQNRAQWRSRIHIADPTYLISIVLRSRRLSDLIAQLQDILKGVHEADVLPEKFDSAVIRAQRYHSSSQILMFCHGSYASYLVPAAAVGAMVYCYMWWKNMANAVATVSKQLENVRETLAVNQIFLATLENLDFKVEEQKEITQLIANVVRNNIFTYLTKGRSILLRANRLYFWLCIHFGNLRCFLWYLCQVADGVKGQLDTKPLQHVSAKLGKHSTTALEDKSPKDPPLERQNIIIPQLERQNSGIPLLERQKH
ncbi:hypothetical protein DVH24_032412 [Malus domestica]|uniref:DUF1664 domain-containing protein n=1 Tax=Malus domestica TaxID=3750 RepID=A0A498J5Q1_MALDO|nr:hypothetical protein DVH24_032412 [Malus domestica]